MNVIRQRTILLNFMAIGFILFCSLQCFANKTIFIFLGAPGAGKGTLTEQCVKQLGFQELSTGKLCREEIESGSQKGKIIEEYSMSVGLTPDDIIIEMVETWLTNYKGDKSIIFDGYPRTKNQAVLLAKLLKNKFAEYIVCIFLLEALNDEELFQRISNRWLCENKKCQAVYNRAFLKDSNKGRCDACDAKLIRRADDQEEIVRVRFKGFVYHNNEIISFYQSIGTHVEVINVSKVSPKEVFEKFKKNAQGL